MIWVINAFSTRMIAGELKKVDSMNLTPSDFLREDIGDYVCDWDYAIVHFSRVPLWYVADLLKRKEFHSAIGHESTARVLSERLGIEIPAVRVNVALSRDDTAILVQLDLPRLAEGEVLTREQMESSPLEFYVIDLE